jgi:hypothetical protein
MTKRKKPTEAVRIKSALVDCARNIAKKEDSTIRAVIERALKYLAALPK